jgi:autotransporter-associated beta strand protein
MDAYGAARVVTPTITATSAVTLTIGANTASGAAGQDLSLGAVISGTVAITKSFTSTLTLSGNNTFSGAKILNAGVLNINHANALGNVAGSFTINGGTIDNTSGSNLTMPAYPLSIAGDFTYAGTIPNNLNLGAGATTYTGNRIITVNGGTLTIGGAISAPTQDLTKAGAGTLNLGATAKTFNDLLISAGPFTSTSNILTLSGNLTNNGTFAGNTGTTLFNGPGTTQTISGTAGPVFVNLSVASGAKVSNDVVSTATVSFTVSGTGYFIHNAVGALPGGARTFNNTGTPATMSTIEYQRNTANTCPVAANYGNLILNISNYTAAVGCAGNLANVAGDFKVQSTTGQQLRLVAAQTTAHNVGGNLSIEGSTAILVLASGASGAGTPSVTVAGNLQVSNGTLDLGLNAGGTPTLNVNGTVTLTGGIVKRTAAGPGTLNVKGDWVNNGGTFTGPNTAVNFNSSTGGQNIGGSTVTTFNNLTNSNSNAGGLSLDIDANVSGVLSLASASEGIISTGSNTVFVTNPLTGAVTRPGTGHIAGNLKRTIGSSGGIYDYPVGTFTAYAPASINFIGINTAGNVNVTTTDGVSVNYPVTLNPNKQLARTWDITNGGVGTFSANATFTFLNGDLLNGAQGVNLKAYKFDAPSSWSYPLSNSSTANTFSYAGITSFSEFGAGECAGSLAVGGTVTPVTCNSGNDGAISTSATGNTAPVTYLWNTVPSQSTPNISGLVAGSYMVTVTELTTCSASNTFVVTEPAAVPPPVSGGNQAVCYNGNPTQTITATATSPFTVNWYDALTGGNQVASPIQVGIGSVTYYAEAFDGTCSSLTRTAVTLKINTLPAIPAAINGPHNVCPYVGTADQLTYSIDPVPFADSYQWVIPPTVSLVSTAPDGTSITVTIGANFIPNANKVIKVRSLSACGNSAYRSYFLLAQFPSTPGPITGPTDICALIGTANTATYKINKVIAATTYAWTTPAGINSVVHPEPPGVNDTVIVVTFASDYTTSSISVAAANDCGTSGSVRSFLIPRTSAAQLGLISGPTNVCPHILPAGTPATYKVRKSPGGSSYTWTTPGTWTVSHENAPGANDTAIFVSFPAGFTGGSMSVTVTNGCGTSTPRTLSVTKLSPASPGVLDVIQTDLCPARAYTYTLASMPANSTSLNWTVPAGASYVIITPTPPKVGIKVTYPSTAVNGAVTVQAVSNCGTSAIRSSVVKLPACPPPGPRESAIFSRNGGVPVEGGGSLELNVFPNPTVSDFKLQVITVDKEVIRIRILDMQGREFKQLRLQPHETVSLGNELKAGAYMVEAIQGKERKMVKLVKF